MKFGTLHAQDRALERYGILLKADDFATIGDACASGKAPIMRIIDAGTVHIVEHRGIKFVILLNIAKTRIVTCLPPDYFTKEARLRHLREQGRLKKRPSPRRERVAINEGSGDA